MKYRGILIYSVEEREVPYNIKRERGNCSNREFPSTTPNDYSMTCQRHGTYHLEWTGEPNSRWGNFPNLVWVANRSGLAVAARQGALLLRDLHEDTTGPVQGKQGGRSEFPKGWGY